MHVKIYCIYKVSSSCCTISMDIPDPLSPLLPIVHCFWQAFRTTSRIYTELLYVGLSWLSCLCSVMQRGPQEYITYELILLLQQCPTCLVYLILMVFMIGDKWPYSYCFEECCLQDLFSIARSILV